MLEQSESNILREEAINAVKNSALEWFGGVFEFLLKDFEYLRSRSTGLQACNKCEENAEQIERLEKRVTELESTNLKLKDQITKLEYYSRKNSLIIQGVPETGPNEKTKDIVADLLQNNLQIDDNVGITISDTHRLVKPPHLISKPSKAPRDIIVCFQSAMDRALVWNNQSKLKNSKFILSKT